MLTKDQVAASMLRECDICLHLFTKLGAESFGYRPGEGQRSTLELLRYLAICASAGLDCMAHGDWKRYAAHAEAVKDMAPEAFPDAMARQKEAIAAFFGGISEEALRTQSAPLPGGRGTQPLGEAILNGPFKWISAYKLQLFLYAKANGAAIGTVNAWAGMDSKPQ
jgi:hypothetical protein